MIVFGDEPYGNYNRILLSNVLAGADDTSEIFLNPLDWYADNHVDLRACGWFASTHSRIWCTPTTARSSGTAS